RVPERANLVARIPGRGSGPSLLLLSHTDTVLADPVEWTVDPWSGELRDGHVWGRGALDMKGQVAASAVAIASLAREGFQPAAEPRLGPETEAFLQAVLGRVPPASEALDAARAVDPVAAELLEPLLALTVAPTMIEASQKRNVIPALCEVTVDCRLLPGQTQT